MLGTADGAAAPWAIPRNCFHGVGAALVDNESSSPPDFVEDFELTVTGLLEPTFDSGGCTEPEAAEVDASDFFLTDPD